MSPIYNLGCLLIPIASLVATSSDADTITADDLRIIAKSTRERLHGIDVTYHVRVTCDPVDVAATPEYTVRARLDSRHLYCQFNRQRTLSARQQAVNLGGLQQVARDEAWDGEVQTIYDPTSRSGTIKPVEAPAADPRRTDKFLTLALRHAPAPGGNGVTDGSLESLLQDIEVRPDREIVGEDSYLVIDCFIGAPQQGRQRFATVSLDENRGYMARKVQFYGDAETIAIDVNIYEAAEFTDSQRGVFWLPLKATTKVFAKDRRVTEELTVDPQSVHVNPPLSGTDFRVDFPQGTHVLDKATGMSFVVGSPGPATINQPAKLPSKAISRAMLVFNLVMVSTAVGIYFLRRLRWQTSTNDATVI